MEKRKPHYLLDQVKTLFAGEDTRLITREALKNTLVAHLGKEDILECVRGLSHADFYKSMTSQDDHTLWQDVYQPTYKGRVLYIKLQISHDSRGVVIQFKLKETPA